MHVTNILLFVVGASAHTIFANLFVDGTNEGDATCVRMTNDNAHATSPISSVTSPDMACGVNGETGVARVCPANAGSVLTFEFRLWADGSQPGSIDQSHKGPCAVYMKKVDDASESNNAQGNGWFKIWQEDYDEAEGKWCTEKRVVDTNGLLSVQLPSDIQSGYYLVRPELLALHNADKNPPDPQFYIGCAQIFLSSTGSSVPQHTVSIPGYINMESNRAALSYHIWGRELALPYPMFGPPVYGSASASKRHFYSRATSQLKQEVGLRPEGCVLEIGNWCGMEIEAYSDESSCWAASESCWNQTTTCYDSAGPTGGKDCRIWEEKCRGIQETCSSGGHNGPPNAGTDLTPQHRQVEVPPAVNAGQFHAVPANQNASPSTPTTLVTTTPAPSASASLESNDTENSPFAEVSSEGGDDGGSSCN